MLFGLPCAAILLIKAVNAWSAQHGKEPSSAADRREFKNLLRSWQHTIDGIPVEEENFSVRLRACFLPVHSQICEFCPLVLSKTLSAVANT